MQQRMITLCASKRNAPKALGSRDHSVFAIIPSWRYYCGNVLRRIIVVNCHPFDAERSAGRTYLQGCHKTSPSPKDGTPQGLERPGSGHMQGTNFYQNLNFRQVKANPNSRCHSSDFLILILDEIQVNFWLIPGNNTKVYRQ